MAETFEQNVASFQRIASDLSAEVNRQRAFAAANRNVEKQNDALRKELAETQTKLDQVRADLRRATADRDQAQQDAAKERAAGKAERQRLVDEGKRMAANYAPAVVAAIDAAVREILDKEKA